MTEENDMISNNLGKEFVDIFTSWQNYLTSWSVVPALGSTDIPVLCKVTCSASKDQMLPSACCPRKWDDWSCFIGLDLRFAWILSLGFCQFFCTIVPRPMAFQNSAFIVSDMYLRPYRYMICGNMLFSWGMDLSHNRLQGCCVGVGHSAYESHNSS